MKWFGRKTNVSKETQSAPEPTPRHEPWWACQQDQHAALTALKTFDRTNDASIAMSRFRLLRKGVTS